MADYRDYEFLRDPFEGWILNGYCITMVEGPTTDGFLELVGARIWPGTVIGYEQMNLAWPATSEHYIGVTTIDGGPWVLVIETAGGFMGIADNVMGPVAAAGHTIVSIYGGEGAGRISWWEHGVQVAHIEVNRPDYDGPWSGADPHRIKEVWESTAPEDIEERSDLGWVYPQALFAASETITGIPLTLDLLTQSEFTLATVPDTPPPVAGQYTGRLRDAGWDARAVHP